MWSILLAGLPAVLYMLPLLIAYLLWGQHGSFRRLKNAWCWELRENSWPMRTWYKNWGGTTLSHCIMFAPGPGRRIEAHELHHVDQFDAQSLCGNILGTILAIQGHWVLGLLVWVLLPGLCYLSAGINAAVSGRRFYRDNVFEVGAYAVGHATSKE